MTVDVLRVPDAPGFILLGGAPSAVERPGTVQALAVSLISSAADGGLLDEFAVQVSPFWLGGIPDLDYASYEDGATGFEAFRRTFSVSAATSRLELMEGDPTTAIALGGRFSLATGGIDQDYDNYGARRDSAFAALARFNADVTTRHQEAMRNDAEIQRLDSLRREFAADPEKLQEIAQSRQKRTAELLRELKIEDKAGAAEAIGSLPERRLGFVADVAGGWSAVFPRDDFDSIETYRWGAWMTAGYAGRSGSVLGVVRYLREGELVGSGVDGSALDLGGRLIWDASNGKLSLSGEGVYRLGIEDGMDDRYRVAGEVTYAAAPNRNISLTLGRDFEGEATGNVLALLRLVANFGSSLQTSREG
ncbi:MAG: hypothetical protein AAGI91_14765 [Bacteroidota bacterium]